MNRRVIRKELWTKFDVERRDCKRETQQNGFGGILCHGIIKGILCHGNQGREKQQVNY